MISGISYGTYLIFGILTFGGAGMLIFILNFYFILFECSEPGASRELGSSAPQPPLTCQENTRLIR
jgi:hypothetical protein